MAPILALLWYFSDYFNVKKVCDLVQTPYDYLFNFLLVSAS